MGSAAQGCEFMSLGLWQERGPMRYSCRSGGCGELRVLFEPSSGQGSCPALRPLGRGAGEMEMAGEGGGGAVRRPW